MRSVVYDLKVNQIQGVRCVSSCGFERWLLMGCIPHQADSISAASRCASGQAPKEGALIYALK